jgi:serine/threonine-protein kinase
MKHGYYLIPQTFHEKWRDRPEAFKEGLIGRCVDDYLVVDKLGRGGFGNVYLSLQLPVQMKAAIKILKLLPGEDELTDAMRDSLDFEARALAALSHPNIVRLLKYNGNHETPYMAIEYVEWGKTLSDELIAYSLREEWPRREESWHILSQILHALEAAHGAGVVHRDINPNNIMLQNVAGNSRFVRLLDFGVGRMLGDESEEDRYGTPEYIAPETLEGDPSGPATDLYAVGVLAFVLLNAGTPFPADTVDEIIDMKTDSEFDPAALLAESGGGEPTVGFFRRALAKEPKNRFRQAADMLSALTRVVEELPVES